MRPRGLLLVTLVAGLALTACGGSTATPPAPEETAAAAPAGTGAKIRSQLAAQQTYSYQMSLVSVDQDGKPFLGQLEQTGAVQLSPLATQAESSLVSDGQPVGDASATIFVGGKAYVRDSGNWTPLSEQDADYQTRLVQRDPAALLAIVAAVQDLREAGQDTVDGTATSGFAGTFQREWFDTLPKDDPAVAGLKDVYVPLESSKIININVAVDSTLLVRRIIMVWMSEPAGGAPALTTSATVTFSKFNAPVDIKPPA
jgi:LppX_LprAFG lipoprotein